MSCVRVEALAIIGQRFDNRKAEELKAQAKIRDDEVIDEILSIGFYHPFLLRQMAENSFPSLKKEGSNRNQTSTK